MEATAAAPSRSVTAVIANWMPRRSAIAPVTKAPTLPMPSPTPIIRLDATPTKAGRRRGAEREAAGPDDDQRGQEREVSGQHGGPEDRNREEQRKRASDGAHRR